MNQSEIILSHVAPVLISWACAKRPEGEVRSFKCAVSGDGSCVQVVRTPRDAVPISATVVLAPGQAFDQVWATLEGVGP